MRTQFRRCFRRRFSLPQHGLLNTFPRQVETRSRCNPHCYALWFRKNVFARFPSVFPKLDEKNDIETITDLYENNTDISRITDPHDGLPFRRANNLFRRYNKNALLTSAKIRKQNDWRPGMFISHWSSSKATKIEKLGWIIDKLFDLSRFIKQT